LRLCLIRTFIIKVRVIIPGSSLRLLWGCLRLSWCSSARSCLAWLACARSAAFLGSLGSPCSVLLSQLVLRCALGRCAAHGLINLPSNHLQALPGLLIRIHLHNSKRMTSWQKHL